MKLHFGLHASLLALTTTSLLALAGCGSTVEDGTGGSGGGADVCDDYRTGDDGGAPRPTTVRFVNAGDADIYLGDPVESCGGYVPFALEKDGIPVASRLGLCEFSCEQIMEGGCACPAACEAPTTVRITPGGSYELAWQGFDYLPTTLPEQCLAEDGCAPSCFLPRFASGTYQVTGTAYASVSCTDVGICECTPDENGACLLDFASRVDGAPRNVTVSYDYDGPAWELELVFD
jgi:hypothetical protein